MSDKNQSCDLCGKEIPFGQAYIAILYNIENFERDHLKQEDYVNVVSSDQVFTMCGRCGNKHPGKLVASSLNSIFISVRPRMN